MESILIIITALALAIAATMAVVLITMLRHERARSDARIEALSALAAETMASDGEPRRASTHFSADEVAQWRDAVRPSSQSRPSLEPAHPSPRIVAEPIAIRETPSSMIDDGDVGDFEIRPSVAGVADLFSEPERPSPWVNRLVAIGCFATIVLAIGVGLTTFGSRTAPVSKAAPAQIDAKAAVAPLELLSLRHTQESDRLVITGLVLNPRTATTVAHVAATVFVFGPDGALLSSNQAPLDYTTLTPGGESQFVVSVPVRGQVARYRVGFRTEDGHVLPHVDRRAPDALAQK
ncbi:MAG: hypothetical protein ACJ731_05725 [Vicinamibacterales bacterium]